MLCPYRTSGTVKPSSKISRCHAGAATAAASGASGAASAAAAAELALPFSSLPAIEI